MFSAGSCIAFHFLLASSPPSAYRAAIEDHCISVTTSKFCPTAAALGTFACWGGMVVAGATGLETCDADAWVWGGVWVCVRGDWCRTRFRSRD